MNTIKVENGRLKLYSFVNDEKCERQTTYALLPTVMHADWNGETLNVIDWRINNETHTVKVEYQTRNDAYAPILDATLPVETVTEALKPPGRSKAWQWQPFSSLWLNKRTGERVHMY